jgi:molybdate transport system permease protein
MINDLTPLLISFKTSVVATLITFFLGIAIARWMVVYEGKGKSILDGIMMVPLVLTPTVVGLGLLLLFGRNGVLGQLLLKWGVVVIFSWPATVITAAVVSFPLMYQSARAAFEQIDPAILDASRTLGASEWSVFWNIQMPLAYPGIIAGTILSFNRALGEFGATLMLAGNIPGKTQTIPMAIYFAVQAGDMNTAFYWVVVVLCISFVSLILLNYWKKYQGNGWKRMNTRLGAKDAGS